MCIRNPLGVTDMFIISLVVVIAWPHPDAKVDQIVHMEHVSQEGTLELGCHEEERGTVLQETHWGDFPIALSPG